MKRYQRYGYDLMTEFTALRSGEITLYLITDDNLAAVRDSVVLALDGHEETADFAHEIDNHYCPAYDADGRRTNYGFYAAMDGELVGLSLLSIDDWDNLRGSTGADTLPQHRGKGIAPGSKPHLFHLGFAMLGLNRIETGCLVSNTASKRSIEKTPGFVYEGTLRSYERNDDGAFEDHYFYAIIRPDWENLYAGVMVDVIGAK